MLTEVGIEENLSENSDISARAGSGLVMSSGSHRATTPMTHIAIAEALDGKVADWMEHASDAQYRS
jgi:hypothetical protein